MTSVAVGNKRLLCLANILDRVPGRHWAKDGRLVGYDQDIVRHSCGTPACAWGHWLYTNKKRFKRIATADGLPNGWVAESLLTLGLVGTGIYVSYFDGAEREFAMSENEVREVFHSCGCKKATTGKEAADYIRAFVARRRII